MNYIGEENLVKKEKAIYHFVCGFIFSNYYSPSITDIANAVGVSIATVPIYLRKLKEKNLITFTDSVSRSIVLSQYEYRLVEKAS